MSSIQVQQGAKITPVPFEAGETLLSALRRAGYSIPAACGGKGRCGKCRVKVNGVPREDHFMITVASEVMALSLIHI